MVPKHVIQSLDIVYAVLDIRVFTANKPALSASSAKTVCRSAIATSSIASVITSPANASAYLASTGHVARMTVPRVHSAKDALRNASTASMVANAIYWTVLANAKPALRVRDVKLLVRLALGVLDASISAIVPMVPFATSLTVCVDVQPVFTENVVTITVRMVVTVLIVPARAPAARLPGVVIQ